MKIVFPGLFWPFLHRRIRVLSFDKLQLFSVILPMRKETWFDTSFVKTFKIAADLFGIKNQMHYV